MEEPGRSHDNLNRNNGPVDHRSTIAHAPVCTKPKAVSFWQ